MWVNSATDPQTGDCFLPAVVRRGGLAVAVSTGGASPALARRIRERLEAEFDDAFAAWIGLLDELRPVVLAAVAPPRGAPPALAVWSSPLFPIKVTERRRRFSGAGRPSAPAMVPQVTKRNSLETE